MIRLLITSLILITFQSCSKEETCQTCTRYQVTTKYETDSINGGYSITSVDTTIANVVEACSDEDKDKYSKQLEDTTQYSWGYYHYKIIPYCK